MIFTSRGSQITLDELNLPALPVSHPTHITICKKLKMNTNQYRREFLLEILTAKDVFLPEEVDEKELFVRTNARKHRTNILNAKPIFSTHCLPFNQILSDSIAHPIPFLFFNLILLPMKNVCMYVCICVQCTHYVCSLSNTYVRSLPSIDKSFNAPESPG